MVVGVVANVAVNVDSRGAQNKLRSLDSTANKLNNSFKNLAGTLVAGLGFAKVIADTKELDTNLRR